MESAERTCKRIVSMQIEGDRLHERFHRLRNIVQNWEIRIAELPELVLELFHNEDLKRITELLEEKKLLNERIRLLNVFIQKWENPGFESILGVTKFEDEQGREVFQ